MKYVIDTERMALHLAEIGETKRAEFALDVLRNLHQGTLLVGWITPYKKRKKAVPKEYTEYFEAFWLAYPMCPRKSAKKKAFKDWWHAADGDEEALLAKCLPALEWQSLTDGWTKEDRAWIPMPSSWINQARWEDENPNELRKRVEYVNNDGLTKWRYIDE